MSLLRPLLNGYLRLVEKRKLARTRDVHKIRRDFARTARLLFRAPRGTQLTRSRLTGAGEVLRVAPAQTRSDLVIFYIHGGGFVFGSPDTHSAMLGALAQRLGATAVLPYYRLAPEAPFPAAIEDVAAAYQAVLDSGVAAHNIILGGDSAGGALAFNLLSRLCAEADPLPRALFVFSPLTDFLHEGASFRENAAREAVLPAAQAGLMAEMYLAGASPSDPAVSPLRADYHGAPPVWITVGSTEILRDDARRMSTYLQDQNVNVTLVEEHDLPHVWPIFHNFLPEARTTLDALTQWIKQVPSTADES
ncbi:alpha/beta hydrolase [Sulfitobacter litoralis]|uniref:alpha/beta hydrolase n=1 Tax=Sulfitobacter litoralis TaxID=335975 RepID=UPI002B272296|nr:alpha/beta hydrolase [Sulfitobacter litoralis]